LLKRLERLEKMLLGQLRFYIKRSRGVRQHYFDSKFEIKTTVHAGRPAEESRSTAVNPENNEENPTPWVVASIGNKSKRKPDTSPTQPEKFQSRHTSPAIAVEVLPRATFTAAKFQTVDP
jgi:hypothetical protein